MNLAWICSLQHGLHLLKIGTWEICVGSISSVKVARFAYLPTSYHIFSLSNTCTQEICFLFLATFKCQLYLPTANLSVLRYVMTVTSWRQFRCNCVILNTEYRVVLAQVTCQRFTQAYKVTNRLKPFSEIYRKMKYMYQIFHTKPAFNSYALWTQQTYPVHKDT